MGKPEECQTYNLSTYKNLCEETNQILSKSSSDGATYSKYQLLNKLGMHSEIKHTQPPIDQPDAPSKQSTQRELVELRESKESQPQMVNPVNWDVSSICSQEKLKMMKLNSITVPFPAEG